MKEVLRKVHNLMISCSSVDEFQAYSFEVYYVHRELKAEIIELFNYGTLAAEHSLLPIYYFEATKHGLRQDRFGNFFSPEAMLKHEAL
jgi:hypothetical protein